MTLQRAQRKKPGFSRELRESSRISPLVPQVFLRGSRFWPLPFSARLLFSSVFSSAYSVPPCFKGFAVLRASAVKPLILLFSVSLCLRGRCYLFRVADSFGSRLPSALAVAEPACYRTSTGWWSSTLNPLRAPMQSGFSRYRRGCI